MEYNVGSIRGWSGLIVGALEYSGGWLGKKMGVKVR